MMPRRSIALAAVALCTLSGMQARASEPAPFDPVPISGSSPFPVSCGQPGSFVNTEIEPQVAVNPLDHRNIIAAFQQDRYRDGASRGDVLRVTHDGGATWRTVIIPGMSACTGGLLDRATDPWVSFGPEGRAYALIETLDVSFGPDSFAVVTSMDGGDSWSAPFRITFDAVAFSDKGALTADPYRPGTAYLVFLRAFSPVGWFTRSTDGGATWLPPLPLHLGGQGHVLSVLPNGDLLVVANESGLMRSMRSSDGGLTWSPLVTIGSGRSLNPDKEMIRDFNLPSLAVAPDGSAWVTWEDEAAIVAARSTDNGDTWTTMTVTSNDRLAFVPAIAVTPSGAIGITYYDTRSSVPSSHLADEWISVSNDNGRTWSERHLSGPFDLAYAPEANGAFIGDYQGLATTGSAFVTLFARPAAGTLGVDTDVYLGIVAP